MKIKPEMNFYRAGILHRRVGQRKLYWQELVLMFYEHYEVARHFMFSQC